MLDMDPQLDDGGTCCWQQIIVSVSSEPCWTCLNARVPGDRKTTNLVGLIRTWGSTRTFTAPTLPPRGQESPRFRPEPPLHGDRPNHARAHSEPHIGVVPDLGVCGLRRSGLHQSDVTLQPAQPLGSAVKNHDCTIPGPGKKSKKPLAFPAAAHQRRHGVPAGRAAGQLFDRPCPTGRRAASVTGHVILPPSVQRLSWTRLRARASSARKATNLEKLFKRGPAKFRLWPPKSSPKTGITALKKAPHSSTGLSTPWHRHS